MQQWGRHEKPKEMVKVPGTYRAGEAKVADVNGDHSADLVLQTPDDHFYVSLGAGHDFMLT